MEGKHTAGPWSWKYEDSGGYDCMSSAYVVSASEGRTIVDVDVRHYGTDPDWDARNSPNAEAEANARLIASAPELLEALGRISHEVREALGLVDDYEMRNMIGVANLASLHECVAQGLAVITKAKGGA